MSMHKCWSLYNKEEKLRIDDLRLDQVKTILLAIPTRKLGEWYACREGDLQWQSLSDVPDFHEEAVSLRGKDPLQTTKSKDEPPPTNKSQAPRRPLFEDMDLDSGDTLTMEAIHTKERRTARRYVRNLTFKIPTAQGFASETADVSMGGVSLKKPLPPISTKTFRAELALDGETIHVVCARVTDKTVRLLESDRWDVLRNWIINW